MIQRLESGLATLAAYVVLLGSVATLDLTIKSTRDNKTSPLLYGLLYEVCYSLVKLAASAHIAEGCLPLG
jgi:hypothetical protein